LGERNDEPEALAQAVAGFDACLSVVASVWPSDWVQAVKARRERALVAQRTRLGL